MEWQQIEGFYTAAKLMSFTKAAEATFRTQSAVSQQVKNLERELGCELFDRASRGNLKLTPAGESLFRFCVEVLGSHDHLMAELHELKGERSGRLRVAASFEVLQYWMPDELKRFTREYPNVELSILGPAPAEIIQLVRDGDVDFGITTEKFIPRDLAAIRWKKSVRVLMTAVDHPLLQKKRITFVDIVKYPLILPSKAYPIRKIFDEKLRQLGLKCHVLIELANVLLVVKYVESGLGISIVSEGLIQQLEKDGRSVGYVGLGDEFASDYIAIVTRTSKKWPEYQRSFVSMLLGESVLAEAGEKRVDNDREER